MKKKKWVYLILLITLVFYTVSLVNKTMQNDTFFYIPIGERIAKTHVIDGLDHWSFHENLRFTYPRTDLQFIDVLIISCLGIWWNLCICVNYVWSNCSCIFP